MYPNPPQTLTAMSTRIPAPGVYEHASLRAFATVIELSRSLGEYVAEHAAAAIDARGRFVIGISGGSALEVRCYCGAVQTMRVHVVCALVQFLSAGLRAVAESGAAIGCD